MTAPACTTEPGHMPNRWYADLQGNLHLNGGALYVDEAGNQISAGNTTTPAPQTFLGNVAANGVQTQINSNVVSLGNIATGIVANGATQATATPLTATNNHVANVATSNNGVILPVPSFKGQEITIVNANSGANLAVYADAGTTGCATGGSIGGGSANASANLNASKGTTYLCTGMAPSAWWSLAN